MIFIINNILKKSSSLVLSSIFFTSPLVSELTCSAGGAPKGKQANAGKNGSSNQATNKENSFDVPGSKAPGFQNVKPESKIGGSKGEDPKEKISDPKKIESKQKNNDFEDTDIYRTRELRILVYNFLEEVLSKKNLTEEFSFLLMGFLYSFRTNFLDIRQLLVQFLSLKEVLNRIEIGKDVEDFDSKSLILCDFEDMSKKFVEGLKCYRKNFISSKAPKFSSDSIEFVSNLFEKSDKNVLKSESLSLCADSLIEETREFLFRRLVSHFVTFSKDILKFQIYRKECNDYLGKRFFLSPIGEKIPLETGMCKYFHALAKKSANDLEHNYECPVENFKDSLENDDFLKNLIKSSCKLISNPNKTFYELFLEMRVWIKDKEIAADKLSKELEKILEKIGLSPQDARTELLKYLKDILLFRSFFEYNYSIYNKVVAKMYDYEFFLVLVYANIFTPVTADSINFNQGPTTQPFRKIKGYSEKVIIAPEKVDKALNFERIFTEGPSWKARICANFLKRMKNEGEQCFKLMFAPLEKTIPNFLEYFSKNSVKIQLAISKEEKFARKKVLLDFLQVVFYICCKKRELVAKDKAGNGTISDLNDCEKIVSQDYDALKGNPFKWIEGYKEGKIVVDPEFVFNHLYIKESFKKIGTRWLSNIYSEFIRWWDIECPNVETCCDDYVPFKQGIANFKDE